MYDNTKYNVIREQGEYMDPVPLTPEENAAIKEAANNGCEVEWNPDKSEK